jgi:hypothetical protein
MQTYEIRLMAEQNWLAETHIFATDSLASAVARAKALLSRSGELASAEVRSRGGVLLHGVGRPQFQNSAA